DKADILDEISRLAEDGVTEVMLLGQNVNSYANGFPKLLQDVAKIEKIQRIRFMTSHPKDLSDELIEVIKNNPKIARHIHLPLQSGSTAILKEMNRRYSKEDYLNLVEKIRSNIDGIAITTDIIVGFPGETEEDFLETLDVVKKAKFDSAFTFIYSKRTGTKAASMPNQVPKDVVNDRFNRLLTLVTEVGKEQTLKYEGTVGYALVEEVNPKDPNYLSGRLSNNSVVHFKGNKDLIGQIVPVRLTEAKGFYYMGSIIE
ncbi:MAG: MiaB/RimO family radical SAM methylthiotransferase, partial [Lachnospiraceae bacterium]|nr:MiaB/RimO family radical SAM methylthiotransferase [Lachnospiraceae bacterium]